MSSQDENHTASFVMSYILVQLMTMISDDYFNGEVLDLTDDINP